MPAQLTYPGVYIEEVPSGVRTITGVATSIAAFVGRAARGPVNDPVMLTSFGDFERPFGGLSRLSSLPFAVRDFFQNGGSQAIVVRLYNAGADPAEATIDANGLLLQAASPARGATRSARGSRRAPTTSRPTSPPSGRPSSRGSRRATSSTSSSATPRPARRRSTATSPSSTVPAGSTRCSRTSRGSWSRTAPRRSRPSSHADPDPGEDIWADDTLSSPVDTDGSDGDALDEATFTGTGLEAAKEGLFALEKADIFNLLVIPPYDARRRRRRRWWATPPSYCERRRAMLDRRPALGLGRGRGRARQRRDGRHDEQERGALLPAHPPAEPALPRPDRRLRPVGRDRRDLRPHRHGARRLEGAGGPDARSSARRRSACR